MEWAAVILWGLVVGIAMPLGAGAAMGAPALGLPPLCALGGFALTVLWIVVNGSSALAWIAFGLALAGVATVVAGASELISEDRDAGGAGEDGIALAAGVAGPMFGVAAALTLFLALGYATVST